MIIISRHKPGSWKTTDSTSLTWLLVDLRPHTMHKRSCDSMNHRSLIIISGSSHVDSRWLRARSTLAYTLLIRFRGVTYGRCNDNGPANARNRGALKSLYNYCHYRRDCADEAALRLRRRCLKRDVNLPPVFLKLFGTVSPLCRYA